VVTDRPVVHPQVIYEYGESRWNGVDRILPKKSKKNLYHCRFVHHNPTFTNTGAKPVLRSHRPATNRLDHNDKFMRKPQSKRQFGRHRITWDNVYVVGMTVEAVEFLNLVQDDPITSFYAHGS
jgi:hypothetical protein